MIPDTPVGLRDRAIILTLILTGRRRTEVLNLKAGDLIQDGDAVLYSYRGKGGKQGKREMPQPASRAIQQALEAFGKDFSTMSNTPAASYCLRGNRFNCTLVVTEDNEPHFEAPDARK